MTDDDCQRFWLRVKEQLKKSKLSLKSYATIRGVSLQTVYGQIKKHRMPSVEDFLILARITNSDPYWLLWGDDPSPEIATILASYASDREKQGFAINYAELVKLSEEMQNLITTIKEKK